MLHYFATEELGYAYDSNQVREWATDHGDKDADDAALQRFNAARQDAEDYVRSRVEVRYDVDQWEDDPSPADGISTLVPGVLKRISIDIALYYLASRRPDVPSELQRRYDIAELKLERIASGVMLLGDTSTSAQTIGGNMTEDDLGQLTQDGEPLQWSEIL
jgi:phage gp36-like protein